MAAKQSTSKSAPPSSKKSTGGSDGGGYNGGGGDHHEPAGEEPENLDIHEAYLRYRIGGGEPPTAQAYARAFDQFKKLPGAVRGKPRVTPPDPPEAEEEGQSDRTGKKP